MTIDPLLIEAVDDATSEAERAICPLYEVRPQQRLAFLDDLDSILCTDSRPRARHSRPASATRSSPRATSRSPRPNAPTRNETATSRSASTSTRPRCSGRDRRPGLQRVRRRRRAICWSTSSCPTPATSLPGSRQRSSAPALSFAPSPKSNSFEFKTLEGRGLAARGSRPPGGQGLGASSAGSRAAARVSAARP